MVPQLTVLFCSLKLLQKPQSIIGRLQVRHTKTGVWFQIPSQSQVSPQRFPLIKEAHLNLCEKVKFNPPDHTSVYCGRACMGQLPFAVVKCAHTRSPSTVSVYRKSTHDQSASLSLLKAMLPVYHPNNLIKQSFYAFLWQTPRSEELIVHSTKPT